MPFDGVEPPESKTATLQAAPLPLRYKKAIYGIKKVPNFREGLFAFVKKLNYETILITLNFYIYVPLRR